MTGYLARGNTHPFTVALLSPFSLSGISGQARAASMVFWSSPTQGLTVVCLRTNHGLDFSALSLLNTGRRFFLNWQMLAPIIVHARLRDLLQMLVCPDLEHLHGLNQGLS